MSTAALQTKSQWPNAQIRTSSIYVHFLHDVGLTVEVSRDAVMASAMMEGSSLKVDTLPRARTACSLTPLSKSWV